MELGSMRHLILASLRLASISDFSPTGHFCLSRDMDPMLRTYITLLKTFIYYLYTCQERFIIYGYIKTIIF